MSAFVLEHPHMPALKKHNRHLILACDRCRRQKRKCQIDNTSQHTGCKSCNSAGLDCTFIDRKKNITQKEQHMLEFLATDLTALPGSAVSPEHTRFQETPTSEARTSSAFTEPPSILFPEASDGIREHYLTSGSMSSFPFKATAYNPGGSITELASVPFYSLVPKLLRDPNSWPIILDAIQTFFEVYGHKFPFLSHSSFVDNYWQSTLPLHLTIPILLISLPHLKQTAAYEAWLVEALEAELTEFAKVQISLYWDFSTTNCVKAYLLMAHCERSKGNDYVAQIYENKAREASANLRLDDRSVIASMTCNEAERDQLQALADFLYCKPTGSLSVSD